MAEIWAVSSSDDDAEPVQANPRRVRNILECNIPKDNNKRKRHGQSARLLQEDEVTQRSSKRISARICGVLDDDAGARIPEQKSRARNVEEIFDLTPGDDAGATPDVDVAQRARREQMSKLTAAFGGADDDDELDDIDDNSPAAPLPSVGAAAEEDDDAFDIDQELASMAAARKQVGQAEHVSDAHEGGADADDGTMVLKAQCKSGFVKIRIGADETFQAFLEKLKRHALDKQWARPGQLIRITLDGDNVSATDTPETHALEGGEALDVVVYDP